MIHQYQFALVAPDGQRISPFWAYRLYAWLLEQIPAAYGAFLHQQRETPIAQYLCYQPE